MDAARLPHLNPTEAVERIETIVAHAWMVRTFLKHAPEFEEDTDRMEIPRTIFDFARAVETRRTAGPAEYLRMVRKKLSKLRAATTRFAREQPGISNHTNFQQAAISLTGCVRQIEELLNAVPTADAAADPTES